MFDGEHSTMRVSRARAMAILCDSTELCWPDAALCRSEIGVPKFSVAVDSAVVSARVCEMAVVDRGGW